METVKVWVKYISLSTANIWLEARWSVVLGVSAFVLVTGLFIGELWYSVGVTTLFLLVPSMASVVAAVRAGRHLKTSPTRLVRKALPSLRVEVESNLRRKR